MKTVKIFRDLYEIQNEFTSRKNINEFGTGKKDANIDKLLIHIKKARQLAQGIYKIEVESIMKDGIRSIFIDL